MQENYTPRKKRKHRRRSPLPVILLMMLLCVVAAFSGYLLKDYMTQAREKKILTGTWACQADISSEYMANMQGWLSDLSSETPDTEWLIENSDDISPTVVLTFEKDKVNGGTFTRTVDQDSYDECYEKAYGILSDYMISVIKERLIAVGYSDDMSEEETSALITEILGMSLDQYLDSKGISLIPSYETLQSEYGASGTYTADSDTITFYTDLGEETLNYAISSNIDIFIGTDHYTRLEAENENN